MQRRVERRRADQSAAGFQDTDDFRGAAERVADMLQDGDGNNPVEGFVHERQRLADAQHVGAVVVDDLECDDIAVIDVPSSGAAVQNQPVAAGVDQLGHFGAVGVLRDVFRLRDARLRPQRIRQVVHLVAVPPMGHVIAQECPQLRHFILAQVADRRLLRLFTSFKLAELSEMMQPRPRASGRNGSRDVGIGAKVTFFVEVLQRCVNG